MPGEEKRHRNQNLFDLGHVSSADRLPLLFHERKTINNPCLWIGNDTVPFNNSCFFCFVFFGYVLCKTLTQAADTEIFTEIKHMFGIELLLFFFFFFHTNHFFLCQCAVHENVFVSRVIVQQAVSAIEMVIALRDSNTLF